MKVKDVRLHFKARHYSPIVIYNQNGIGVCSVLWGKIVKRTQPQAIAIAKRLCDRFNSGQEGKS